MPQSTGRRVRRRLSRWRAARPGTVRSTFATFATAIAIIGALISESGILARSPHGSLKDPSASAVGLTTGGYSAVPASVLSLSDGLVSSLGPLLLAGPLAVALVNGPDRPLAISPVQPGVPAATPPKPVTKPRPAVHPKTKPTTRPTTKPTRRPTTALGAWRLAPTVTWYGPGFYGGRTACGQRYTRDIVGVASKTLACGTLVQFRYHGITVVAPVIDRGPYGSPDMVFDFSAALACDLFRERGQPTGCYTRHNVHWRIVGRRRNQATQPGGATGRRT